MLSLSNLPFTPFFTFPIPLSIFSMSSHSSGVVRATGVEHSRRFLRELDEAPRGNNLQYILKCPCIPFFGNQRLHNKIVLGGNRGRSGVMCKESSYIYSSSKVVAPWSNGSGIENGIEYKGTSHTWLRSAPHCLPTQIHCAAPGYQRMECRNILVYIVNYSL